MSVLVYYTYVWMGTLYHCLDSNIIPLSALHFYTYFCYTILYLGLLWLLLLLPNWIYSLLCLLLVCNIISTSVISNSVFPNLFQTGYTYVWFAKLYLHLLYLLLLWSNWIIPTSGIGEMKIIPSSVISTYGAPNLFVRQRTLFSHIGIFHCNRAHA